MSDEEQSGRLVNVNIDLGKVGPGVVKLANRAADGVSTVYADGKALMHRLFGGAVDQAGLALTERVTRMRTDNLAAIGDHAVPLLPPGEVEIHPRLLGKLANEGSWASDDHMRRQWAGLLAASVSRDGEDEANLLFMDLLSRISSIEAKLLELGCKRARPFVTPAGLVQAYNEGVTFAKAREVTGLEAVRDVHRNVEHLKSLGLFNEDAGVEHLTQDDKDRVIAKEHPPVWITPSSLGLELYARCQGHRGPVGDFYKPPPDNECREVDRDHVLPK